MKTITVNLKNRSYNIHIGYKILEQAGRYLDDLSLGQDAYIITNTLLKKKYGALLRGVLMRENFRTRFRLIPDTEESKSLSRASETIKNLAAFDKKKSVFIIAFGGGVVGDLAGFIASIYKRGIPYLSVPTTLLAQVDSSIGGKTGVDLEEGKNLVGAFYQPKVVISDIALLSSLSRRQLRAGLAEVIKYALIKDPILLAFLENNHRAVLEGEPAALEYIVGRSSSIKAQIVQEDEKEEKGIRTILNFGHTIGHAIEAAGKYKGYNHGEAIALGMLVVCDISHSLGFIDKQLVHRVAHLIHAVGLPTRIEKLTPGEIIEAHYYDKKFIGVKNKFVLLAKAGKSIIAENIPLTVIKSSLRKRI